MNEPPADPIVRIAEAVTAHLGLYPDAVDTARGVRDWWLPADLRSTPLDEVERALSTLVSQGRLVALSLAAGGTQFARGREPLDD